MNGRVYDAELGRFLSADPNVQAPYATQNLNRYSYAMNNPLKYTDPSGFFFKKLFKSIKKAISNAAKFVKKYWRVIVAAVVTYYTFGAVQGWALGLGTSCTAGSIVTANVIAGAAAGFAGGLIASGGDLKAAMVGGLTGAAGGFIGASSAFGSTASRVLAHGAVGGLSSKAQGGKFSSGFISSAFTKSVSGRIQTIAGENAVGGVLATAAVGGTASVMGGGKFANGAVTSSLQYVVNQISFANTAAHSIGKALSKIEEWFARPNFNNFADGGMLKAGCASIKCSIHGAGINRKSQLFENYSNAEAKSALRLSAVTATPLGLTGSIRAGVFISSTAVMEDVITGSGPANTGIALASYAAGSRISAYFKNPALARYAGGIAGTVISYVPIVTAD